MKTVLRILAWALVVAGGVLIALLVIGFFATDEPDSRPGVAVFTLLLVAVEGWAIHRLRRPPRPPRVDAPDRPSEAIVAAYERVDAGESVLLAPSRRRWGLLLGLFLAFTGLSTWATVAAQNAFVLLVALPWVFGAVLAALNLIPGRAYLRIAADGLVARQPLRTTRWDWNDIENFTGYEIHHRGGSTKQVGFDLRHLTPDKQGFWKTVSRGMVGVDVALPDTYGVNHHQLAQLLSDARDRYATEHGLSLSAHADLALARQAARVRRDRLPAVTAVLLVACVAVFAVEVARFGAFPSAQDLHDMGGASRDALADGRWWTLLSANVLHANPIHLLFNLAGLGIIGVLLEREVGWARFALACLAGGIAAMGLAVLIPQGSVTVGISGVIFAISAWAVLRDTHRTRALGTFAWATLPVGVIYTFFTPHVSIGAHMGGLLAGLAVGHAFERGRRREPVSQTA